MLSSFAWMTRGLRPLDPRRRKDAIVAFVRGSVPRPRSLPCDRRFCVGCPSLTPSAKGQGDFCLNLRLDDEGLRPSTPLATARSSLLCRLPLPYAFRQRARGFFISTFAWMTRAPPLDHVDGEGRVLPALGAPRLEPVAVRNEEALPRICTDHRRVELLLFEEALSHDV